MENKQTEYEQQEHDGYIIMGMSESLRPIFYDMLRGFEDYAKLKGYVIAFTLNTTIKNKIAFKFTVLSGGEVTNQTVRTDIVEYIERLSSGAHFDDLPVVISQAEHLLISTTLKNRLTFLQYNYELEKNMRTHYQKLIETISEQKVIESPYLYSNQRQEQQTYYQLNNHNFPIVAER